MMNGELRRGRFGVMNGELRRYRGQLFIHFSIFYLSDDKSLLLLRL